jgi:DNA-binding NtrC family response regulator
MIDEHILVVDDDESIRQMMSSMLSHAGFECRTVGSGQEAISVLQSDGSYGLLLSDLAMKDMDGFALLDRIRRIHPQMPVVVVTAIHDISVALAGIRSGAYDYLLNPFERDQLLATVRRALENRRLRMENLAYQNKLETLVSARTGCCSARCPN